MPALSWNEIRQRAIQFSREWMDTRDERAEAQTFWNEFFNVFGVKRRTVAAFEEPVRSLKNTYHRIDLFWKGRLLAEHKSAGQSLDKAESQAFQYIQELAASGRQDEIPRYVVLSNFHQIALYDLEPEEQRELPLWQNQRFELFDFPLQDLHRHIKLFAFFIGQKTHRFGEEDPANLKAAQLMADLHDAVRAGNYTGAHLERLLVRLLFCLFADDTGIFEAAQFELFLENKTRQDGTDLGARLNALFDILNSPPEERSTLLDEDVAAFPYVNGELFADRLPTAGFNRDMRNRLLAACRFDWSRISPAIFGSLFQGIMDAAERRQIGAHYTTERNILKVIRPLFLDELQSEFEQIKKDRSRRKSNRLREFQQKLANLKILDPACGCGNFLVIAYRELRRLELETLKLLYGFDKREKELDLGELAKLSLVDVDQFYGIEIGEWPTRIAETALWLTDHQMNTELTLAAGNLFQRIPLRAAPHIQCANALRMDWNDLLPASECSYILGNPPFVGKKEQNEEQKSDHAFIWRKTKGIGILDYVTCWYVKAGEYTEDSKINCGFVSTNSITQGEQVGVFWAELASKYRVEINFAHTTFSWESEAKGKAHVHVVIVGFSTNGEKTKRLFIYEHLKAEPHETIAYNINYYLVEGPNILIKNRSEPICNCPPISYGSFALDDGNYTLTPEERSELLKRDPEAKNCIRTFIGGKELIRGIDRYCLWLKDISPQEIKKYVSVTERVERVRNWRLTRNRETTIQLAKVPYLFAEIRQPNSAYLAFPTLSSERRNYIPIAYLTADVIASNQVYVISDATTYHFGVLTSAMHMAWVRQVCGRLKSDFRYSARLVYNNFPWPVEAKEGQREKVEAFAQGVLDARQVYLDSGSTLADLYDPLYMPEPLLKAHQKLDRAVDRCYRVKKFESERERVEFLFQLYEKLTTPLALTEAPKKRRRRRRKL